MGVLENLFGEFGTVTDVWVARLPPGFGSVTFAREEDALEAKRKLEGEMVEGSRIRIEDSKLGIGVRGRSRRNLGRSRSRSRSSRSRSSRSRGRRDSRSRRR